jgi:hypothetical protein
MLAAWENGEDDVVLAGYGDGASADAIRLAGSIDVDWEQERVYISYDEYLRKRGHIMSKDGDMN